MCPEYLWKNNWTRCLMDLAKLYYRITGSRSHLYVSDKELFKFVNMILSHHCKLLWIICSQNTNGVKIWIPLHATDILITYNSKKSPTWIKNVSPFDMISNYRSSILVKFLFHAQIINIFLEIHNLTTCKNIQEEGTRVEIHLKTP